MDEEGGLPSDGVESDHVPEKPGLHGTGVTVSWKPTNASIVVAFGDAASLEHGAVLAIDVVEEVRYVECSGTIS